MGTFVSIELPYQYGTHRNVMDHKIQTLQNLCYKYPKKDQTDYLLWHYKIHLCHVANNKMLEKNVTLKYSFTRCTFNIENLHTLSFSGHIVGAKLSIKSCINIAL